MKHTKKIVFLAVAVLMTFPLVMSASSEVQAQQFIIATAGFAEQYSFYVDGIFSLRTLSPIYLFTIITTGDAGTLTLTLTPTAKSSDFLFKLNFAMLGAAYALDATAPQIIAVPKSSPLKIVQKIPINSTFGFATVGIIITGVSNPGDFTFPAPFTMLVELSAPTPPATK